MPTITDWLMVILTAVYLGATIFICVFNNKSAKAAANQLDEMKNSQEQNIRIQLFEKRYDIHKSLSFWLSVAEEVFANSNTDSTLNYTIRTGIFDSRFFGTYPRIDRTQCIDEINKTKDRIESYMDQEQTKGLNEADIQELEKLRERINILDKQIVSHKKSMDLAFEEFNDINLSEFFYLDIDFDKLKSFVNAFYNAVRKSSFENFQALEDAYKIINGEEILHKMKKQLYVLGVNKLMYFTEV